MTDYRYVFGDRTPLRFANGVEKTTSTTSFDRGRTHESRFRIKPKNPARDQRRCVFEINEFETQKCDSRETRGEPTDRRVDRDRTQ